MSQQQTPKPDSPILLLALLLSIPAGWVVYQHLPTDSLPLQLIGAMVPAVVVCAAMAIQSRRHR